MESRKRRASHGEVSGILIESFKAVADITCRIHRQGQTKPCVIYRFLTAGKIEEKIFQRQQTKLGLSTALMVSLSLDTLVFDEY